MKGEEALNQLKALGGGAVVAAIGDGTLAQAELSRQLDDLRRREEELETIRAATAARDAQLTTYHSDLDKWYATNQAALEEAKRLKATGGGGTGDPKTPTGGLTAEQIQAALDERIQTEQAGFLGFQRDFNQLQREHFTRFNEVLDLNPLLQHPEVRKVGLIGAYAQIHKDRLAQHEATTQKAHDDKLREEGAAAERERQSTLPYLTPTGAGSGSPLDALQATQAKDSVVDQATQHYARLQQERQSGARPYAGA